jgi:hypothetical protein
MWRSKFYTESTIGSIYKIFVGTAWIVLLCVAAYNHVQSGEPQILGLSILFIGFILFLIAKISVIKKGKLLTFGASAAENLSKKMAVYYYLGYLFMIVGFIMSF